MRTYEELEQLFGKSRQAIIVTAMPFSREAKILYGNAAAAASAGVEQRQLAGQAPADVGLWGKRDLEIYDCEFDGDLCLGIVADQSEIRARERLKDEEYYRNMEQALEAANVANMAKTKFLSEMSHDIRTPMNAIMGMTDIALSHTQDNRRMEECLKKIKTASGHLMGLINEILDMSRIESGRLTLTEEPFQLADMVHAILIVIKAQALKKQIEFHLELGDIFCENFTGDSMRIQQIFINILSNAVKYTENGGDVWMRLRQRRAGDGKIHLLLEVEDNGIGMDPAFLGRIFEAFERERNTTMSKIEGTGLGMSITKRLVDMMQGDITVESRKGVGSKFSVDLPLKPSEAGVSIERDVLAGKRVLILQGAVEKLEKLPEILKSLGMEADVASCGMEAIDLINDADIAGVDYFAMLTNDKLKDLEISLFLPEVCARKGREFPILLLSESDWSEVEYLLKQAGVSSFVPLPLFESRLAEALYSCTEECRRQKEEEKKKPERNYKDIHILLVEDNELNLEIAVEILKSTGAQVDTACNGQESLEAFRAKPEFYYNLILMDIQMPVMDGLEAARHIRGMCREDASAVPIVAMTANAFVEDRQRSVEAGMNAHITKPLDVQEVLECIDRWSGR